MIMMVIDNSFIGNLADFRLRDRLGFNTSPGTPRASGNAIHRSLERNGDEPKQMAAEDVEEATLARQAAQCTKAKRCASMGAIG